MAKKVEGTGANLESYFDFTVKFEADVSFDGIVCQVLVPIDGIEHENESADDVTASAVASTILEENSTTFKLRLKHSYNAVFLKIAPWYVTRSQKLFWKQIAIIIQ